MTTAVSAGGAIVRLIDLTFRLTGISEQNEQIQMLTRRANIVVQVLTQVIMLQRLVAAGVVGGPLGAVMAVASVAMVVPSIMNEFSDNEESTARGK